jgi:NDP-sugar pyrophosphorylase family protein
MIPKDEYYDMPFLFEKLVESEKKTKVFSMEEYWLDLGKPEDFAKGNNDFRLK